MLVERGDAVVVERRGRRAEDRHVLRALAEGLAVAHELAADVAQRVLGPAALELVDGDDVGEVEHVDLLELAGRAELRRHDVHRVVDERDDAGVALADAGGLDDEQVVAGGPDEVEHERQRLGHLAPAARRERAEEDAIAVEAVHPDPVAEQRAAALAPRRVDGDDGDPQLVLLVGAEAAHQLVGERGLARAAGAGDAEELGARRRRDRDSRTPATKASSSRPVSAAVIARARAARSPDRKRRAAGRRRRRGRCRTAAPSG